MIMMVLMSARFGMEPAHKKRARERASSKTASRF
jgi:hypothetical protein